MLRYVALFLFFLAAPVRADIGVDPNALKDPAQEMRARTLMKQIRCLVCQNQSIEDSNAELAQDLRRLVREQVKGGRSDADIRSYLVDRYGDWVLLKPPLDQRTIFLWASPLLLMLLAGGLITYRRIYAAQNPQQKPAEISGLTEAEEQKIAALLGRTEQETDQ